MNRAAEMIGDGADRIEILALKEAQRIGFGYALARSDLIVEVAKLAAYELPMGVLGFPGVGWLFAGFPLQASVLLCAGPAFA